MITTESLTTHIKFGTSGKATIAVNAAKGTLTLQQLTNDLNIGQKPKTTDYADLPKVMLEFFDPKSIDIVIEALNTIKKNYVVPKQAMTAKRWLTMDEATQLAQAC